MSGTTGKWGKIDKNVLILPTREREWEAGYGHGLHNLKNTIPYK